MTTTTAPDAFTGFPEEALAFYDGLEADNSRTYWTDRREVYERCIRGPMLALVAALEPEFGPGKMFRPYRDVRFSKDKTPYKTHAAAVLHHGDGEGSLYVQLSADGLLTGGGFYRMLPDQVARYRAAVDDDASGGRLTTLLSELTAAGMAVGGEALKRVPTGMPKDHPRADLLRHKGLAVFREHPADAWLGTDEALEVVARDWRKVATLNDWLAQHVGPSEAVDGDGRPVRGSRAVSSSH